MRHKRLAEIKRFAAERLKTGDILAAYALELAIDLEQGQVELDAAMRNIERLLGAVERWESYAESLEGERPCAGRGARKAPAVALAEENQNGIDDNPAVRY